MECCSIVRLLVISVVFSPTQENMITVDCENDDNTMQMAYNNSHFCNTLQCALSLIGNDSIVWIVNGTCHHNTTDTILMYNNISIIGNGPDVTRIQCAHGTGFGFLNVTNIHISSLTLLGCGELRKSTTHNISSECNSTMFFRVSLYFLDIINVDIDNIVVADSIGMGVAMYDVTGNITVTNSTFTNNRVSENETNSYPGGGGFSVEFTFCKPGVFKSSDTTSYTKTNENSSYLFSNCKFLHNKATTVNATATTYANSIYGFGNLQFGRGGGLSVFFKGKAVKNKIEIRGCEFTDNHALWGGGFHADIVDHSRDNVLLIVKSNFTDNHCYIADTVESGYFSVSTGGGAIRIGILFSDTRATVESTWIEIIQSKFSFNSAYFGGGVSCSITKESNRIVASNKLNFTDCEWIYNKARTGSGVDLEAHPFPVGVAPTVMFKSCRFFNNSNHYSDSINKPVGIGALYSDSIPIDLVGNCKFVNNNGSAIAGSATYFSFTNDSTTTFDYNVGSNGGAMALLGNAYLILYQNTTLRFVNNRAFSRGGAIYFISSSERAFISTQKCFMFYYDKNTDQADWNTSFYFENNTDIRNISIFCTTLLPCVWGSVPGSTRIKNRDVTSLFKGTFRFNDDPNSTVGNNSMTDAIKIVVNEKKLIAIPPGKLHKLNITLLDEMDNKVYPVLFVQTSNPNVTIDTTNIYMSDNKIRLYGPIGSNTTLQLQTVNGRPWSFTINVTLPDCPPGLDYNKTGVANDRRCICSIGDYYGVYHCNSVRSVAYIYTQFWAGIIYYRDKLTFVTADCPEGYCTISDNNIQMLPTSLTLKADAEYQAKQCLYRHGVLCGRCNDKYYVATNSLTYECTMDCKYNSFSSILKLLLLKYVPFTIFLLVIIFFNISLVDGPLNSFILFSQIINPVGPNANRIVAKELTLQQHDIICYIYYFVYGPWNLNFFEMFASPFCAYRYDSTIKVLVLEYIPALYPVLLFVLFYSVIPCLTNRVVLSNVEALRMCLLRGERMFIMFRRSWSVRNSIIHGLTTFLVLSYAKVTIITGLLLASTTLYGNLRTEAGIRNVVRLDGTMLYFGEEHLPFAVLACIFLLTIVLIPPLLLLSYPILPILLNKINYQDKWICRHLIIAPMDKCIPFFDAFQSCFKNKYRWFAGLYFLYRAIACALLIINWELTTRLIYQQSFYLVIILIHCICQPYNERRYNILDGTIFIILAMINSVALYNVFNIEMNFDTSLSYVWIQLILVYAPFIYFATFFFYCTFRWCLPQAKRSLLHCLSNYNTAPLPVDDDEMPARLLSIDGSSTTNSNDSSETNDTSGSECNDESDNEQEREMDQFMQCNDLDAQMIPDKREFRRFTT